ncbi:TPA: CsbD family protein [Burkholderia vietnamiensis]|nr:CsbD family protein [Burkholderia vietnamiensis]
MDRNRIEGKLKQVKGSVKEALGKVTGDRETEAEGVAEQRAGKLQEQAGEAADSVRRHTGIDTHIDRH